MQKMNLYWPIYKKLEREVLQLAEQLHFSDDQLDVYSMHISDIIIRCVIEIESISKELYHELSISLGETPLNINDSETYFDTVCLKFLEENWHLSRKKLIVSASNFYFEDIKNQHINPLHKAFKRGTSGSKWKQAYQGLKHNRREEIKNGTVKNLIHALGALFILNLYYKEIDNEAIIMSLSKIDNFIPEHGSKIFSPLVYKALSFQPPKDGRPYQIFDLASHTYDESIYVIKFTDDRLRKMIKDFFAQQEEMKKIPESEWEHFHNSPIIRNIALKAKEDPPAWWNVELLVNKHNIILPFLSEILADE